MCVCIYVYKYIYMHTYIDCFPSTRITLAVRERWEGKRGHLVHRRQLATLSHRKCLCSWTRA